LVDGVVCGGVSVIIMIDWLAFFNSDCVVATINNTPFMMRADNAQNTAG